VVSAQGAARSCVYDCLLGAAGRCALIAQHRVPIEGRLSAGVVVVRTRLARWTRRARLVVLAAVTTVVVLVAVPVGVVVMYLLHAV
jgi:hypothetical protein